MDDIKYTNFIQVIKSLKDAEYLGYGYESSCYRIGDKTYKFYNTLYCDLLNNSKAKKDLLKFKDIIIDNIYFIRALIFYGSSLVGSVTDYAVGKHCGKIYLHRRKLDKLIPALSNLKRIIFELSQFGIYIDDDFFLPNILYDGTNFKLIDTGGYYYSGEALDSEVSNDEDKDDALVIYRKNMMSVMNILFENITGKYNEVDNFIYAFLWDINSPYKDYLVDTDLMINPDETIIGIRAAIEEYVGHNIVNFSSCRNELLRIRKRR